jgi:serine-type D-Ala-D-Ala carboxypeptidase (penicillin-binding protein 5/6)
MKYRKTVMIFCCFMSLAIAAGLAPSTSFAKPKTKSGTPAAKPSGPASKAGNLPGKGNTSATDPAVLTIEGKAAVLAELSTGTRIFEQNQDALIEPASFTKILTLYQVFEAIHKGQLHLQDEIFISENAWRTGGSKMFVGIGSKVPLEELIKGIAVVSGNDACVAVAEHLDGSVEAFVANMNRKAQELGMTRSVFHNPHGLPSDGQITTAADMATLALAYLKQFPEALNYHSMQEYTYNEITQYNRNRLLLKDQTVDGLKTGFVAASGYHLTATANRDGMRLIAVVMGTARPSIREREAAKLLNYGFRRYALLNPFKQDQPVATARVWKGIKDQLELYPAELSNVLLLQSAKNSLRWEVDVPKELTAPIQAYQPIGKISLTVGDTLSKTIAVVSHEDVIEAGWLKRLWQSMLRIHTLNLRYVGIGFGSVALVFVLVLFVARRQSRKSIYKHRRPRRY